MSRKETIKTIIHMWNKDRIPERSAALAFYSMISLAPLAIIGLSVSALFVGGGALEPHVVSFLENVFGSDAVPFFERTIDSVRMLRFNLGYSLLGLALLLYGASRLFVHLRRALKDVFVIEQKEGSGFEKVVREQSASLLYLILSFVLAFIFIVANVALSSSFTLFQEIIGVEFPKVLFYLINSLITLIIVAGLYAVLYRVGSSFEVRWLFAFSGGLVASLGFLILNGVFSLYLNSSLFLSAFGASFFLVALLLWVYYGIQILFLGAEIADVYYRRE